MNDLDLTFLDEELANKYGACDAILKAVLPDGKVIHISDNISPFKFLDTCPLLYHTFEYNAQSRLQASVEASSKTAVIALARYCYTGSYLVGEPSGESILLLQHAETYKIAEDFDVPELQIMAHGNFSCQIEYACCLPKPPKDLLDTIRFIYQYFASDEARRKHNLVDTLLNYCVAVYFYHKLGESLDFLTAVHEIPAFRQDLCRTNIARNFEDDCAAEIIRLPSGANAESGIPPTTLSSRDLPSEMLYDLPCDTAPADLSSGDQASADSAPIEDGRDPVALSFRRRALSEKPLRPEIPDMSKHSVSPSALTVALEKYSEIMLPETESDIIAEEEVCQYERARIQNAISRLAGRPVLPEADRSNEHCGKERLSPIKTEPTTTSDEESYWKGAFGQNAMRTSKVATEGTSHSARRLLFEYGRRNVQFAQKMTLSPPAVDANVATALPHRPRNPETIPDANIAADAASEDEGFAMVHWPQATAGITLDSPMSSPELIPTASIAQAMIDGKAASDDGWTVL